MSQTRSVPAAARPTRGTAYGFVDFIARSTDTPTGHSYIRYGRYSRGREVHVRYAGLYPLYGWAGKIAGAFVPVNSVTGRHEEDTEDRTLVSFRRALTRVEYELLHATVLDAQKNRGNWHALFHNCNEFVGSFARTLGMHTAISSWLPSPMYIESMRILNGH